MRLLAARPRIALLIGLLAAGGWSYLHLGLTLSELVPGHGGVRLLKDFAASALRPALSSEAAFVPEGTPPLIVIGLEAAWQTLRLAVAAMSLSLVLGLVLGFFASTAWWAEDPDGGRFALSRVLRRSVLPLVYACARTLIAFLRSIHEILWAVLFLAAMGISDLAAVVAIALPFGGTLAKLFSELVDEAPRDAAIALRGLGAGDLQVFWFALVPRALPDLIGYAFYRMECALRSSAVLGFFGFPTLGLEIRQSFAASHHREVWTFLYLLLALVVAVDLWSGAIRRRLAS